jgi:phosphinothricin acetyltransferase
MIQNTTVADAADNVAQVYRTSPCIKYQNNPGPSLLVRDGTLADAAVIAEIYNESILLADCTLAYHPIDPIVIEQHMRGFHERETYLVLEDDSYVVGWGAIKRYTERPGYRYCCETSVYLRRTLTGRGYGTRLKCAVIERCRQYGYHHLFAKAWKDNKASIKYNQKLGYEIVGTQREIGYINGRWIDVVIMQLILDDVQP